MIEVDGKGASDLAAGVLSIGLALVRIWRSDTDPRIQMTVFIVAMVLFVVAGSINATEQRAADKRDRR